MADIKRPKWDGGVAVSKGKQAISLFDAYQAELSIRLLPNEVLQFKADIPVLELKLAGKVTVLSVQKASTSAQDIIIKNINKRVVGLRDIIRSSNPNSEISNAFGLSTKITSTILGVVGPADTIVLAYPQYRDWCIGAGILEKDIEELTTLTNSLFSADNVQENSIFTRKAATMNVNTLHRAVEDKITKISALGVHEFELTNPPVAKLFADLIPATAPKTPPPPSS